MVLDSENQLAGQARRKKVTYEARHFSFLETNAGLGEDDVTLIYRERDGRHSRCLLESKVQQLLQELHDDYSHFSTLYLLRKCLSHFFWPSRRATIKHYCRSCFECQMIGPLRPSSSLLPILQLQPLDILGIDYLRPISPIARLGARYILVMVNYFTGFN